MVPENQLGRIGVQEHFHFLPLCFHPSGKTKARTSGGQESERRAEQEHLAGDKILGRSNVPLVEALWRLLACICLLWGTHPKLQTGKKSCQFAR